jgi:hypothetical protein
MKRLSIFFALVLFAAAASAGFAVETGGAGHHLYKADLSGAKMPPVMTTATGEAVFELSGMSHGGGPGGTPGEGTKQGGTGGMTGETLRYTLNVKDIKNVTAAHLHMGGKGSSEGPVIAPLFTGPKKAGEFSGLLAEGTISGKDLKGPLSGKSVQELAKMIEDGNVYVNVHTEKHPAGEIRGQVKPE